MLAHLLLVDLSESLMPITHNEEGERGNAPRAALLPRSIWQLCLKADAFSATSAELWTSSRSSSRSHQLSLANRKPLAGAALGSWDGIGSLQSMSAAQTVPGCARAGRGGQSKDELGFGWGEHWCNVTTSSTFGGPGEVTPPPCRSPLRGFSLFLCFFP